jgi:polyisoprenoid-binding protein YceI
MKNIFVFLFAIVILAACDNSDNKAAGAALQAFDACSCATVKDQNSDDYKKCKGLREADAQFESSYQKCMLAQASGSDTNQVKLVSADNIKRADLGAYIIQPSTSSLKWRGQKITGKKHEGTIAIKSGTIQIEGENIKGGEIIIDMPTLVDTDLEGESKTKLETHLRSDDFFGVDKHKEAKFVIKSATPKSTVQYDVVGDLTIKGITNEVKTSLVVTPNGTTGANIGGSIIFDRSLFDVRYGSDKFFDNLGNDLIKNEVIITFDLKALK